MTTNSMTPDRDDTVDLFDIPIDYESAIEAILFASGDPVTYEQMAKAFEIPISELKQIVREYAEKYNKVNIKRGVILLTYDTSCQLCTKPEFISVIRTALGVRKSAGTLSASTIEALTIIAYQQPVTRAYVDAVRNADSSYAMENLLNRKLIEPKGRKDAPGRPMLYGTTPAFLRSFGLSSLDDLPGNAGDAENIFRAIDRKLHLEEDAGEQITIDEIIGGALPDPSESDAAAETAVIDALVDADAYDPDEDDAYSNATEEAERLDIDEDDSNT